MMSREETVMKLAKDIDKLKVKLIARDHTARRDSGEKEARMVKSKSLEYDEDEDDDDGVMAGRREAVVVGGKRRRRRVGRWDGETEVYMDARIQVGGGLGGVLVGSLVDGGGGGEDG